MSLTISPVTNEMGDNRLSGIARDISEKKHLEEKKILEKESAQIELAGAQPA